jgi:hypothetical protein
MFKIQFETENAAFQDGFLQYEIARILRDLADDIANGDRSGKVWDYDGNSIGHFSITETVRDSD